MPFKNKLYRKCTCLEPGEGDDPNCPICHPMVVYGASGSALSNMTNSRMAIPRARVTIPEKDKKEEEEKEVGS